LDASEHATSFLDIESEFLARIIDDPFKTNSD